jgi:hypothetical protein
VQSYDQCGAVNNNGTPGTRQHRRPLSVQDECNRCGTPAARRTFDALARYTRPDTGRRVRYVTLDRRPHQPCRPDETHGLGSVNIRGPYTAFSIRYSGVVGRRTLSDCLILVHDPRELFPLVVYCIRLHSVFNLEDVFGE